MMPPPGESEAPAAPGPGSANPDGDIECEPPDWGADEDADGVENTAAADAELVQQFDGDAEGLSARRAETAEVRGALCDVPSFLHVMHGQGMPGNQGLEEVKAMKARGVEHVRHRMVDMPTDMLAKSKIARMRKAAADAATDAALMAPRA